MKTLINFYKLVDTAAFLAFFLRSQISPAKSLC